MKKNAVLPYAIIAIIGIVMVIVISVAGNNQRAAMNDDGKEKKEEKVLEPEEIYANSCAGCHANDLAGDIGPNLQKVGSKLKDSEIEEIINKGRGNMPKGTATPEEAKVIAKWLAEEHK